MNPEMLIYQAGNAIAEFARTHDTMCSLYIYNGTVRCLPRNEMTTKLPACLNITIWQQRNGLTSTKWNSIGNALLKLYNKE